MHASAWVLSCFQGLLLGIIAMVFHEAGHLVAAPMVGIRVKTVGVGWKGLYIVREAGPPAKNLIVSLAGPIANLILFACLPWSSDFAIANLCLSFFNLLPLQGSDGARVLQCWRQMKRESQDSATAERSTSCVASSPSNVRITRLAA